MNTVNFRMYNTKTKLWYKDSIDEEDFQKALEHFNWYSDLASDEDVSDAHITLVVNQSNNCCMYSKSDNPTW